MASSAAGEVTLLLQALDDGDSSAADRLWPLVHDELRRIASHRMGREAAHHTLQPTALVHEAYLKLVGSGKTDWRGRAHFVATAARAMRQVLVDHARRRTAAKRGGSDISLTLNEELLSPASTEPELIDLVALDGALQELAELHARHARVVELRFFGGLTTEEVAHVVGVTTRTVEKDWRLARVWLQRRLRAD